MWRKGERADKSVTAYLRPDLDRASIWPSGSSPVSFAGAQLQFVQLLSRCWDVGDIFKKTDGFLMAASTLQQWALVCRRFKETTSAFKVINAYAARLEEGLNA